MERLTAYEVVRSVTGKDELPFGIRFAGRGTRARMPEEK